MELPAHRGSHTSKLTRGYTPVSISPSYADTHSSQATTHHSDNPTNTPAGTRKADTHPHLDILLASVPLPTAAPVLQNVNPQPPGPLGYYSLLRILWSKVRMGHNDHNLNLLCLITQVLSLMWTSLIRSQATFSNQTTREVKKKKRRGELIFPGILSDANAPQPMVTTRLASAWTFPLPSSAHPHLSLPAPPSPDPLTGKCKAVEKALGLRPMSGIAPHLSLRFLICKRGLRAGGSEPGL